MRKLIFISLAIGVVGCKSEPKSVSEIDLNDFKQKISYALGADMGANFSNVPEQIFSQMDKNELENGFFENLTSEEKQAKDCQAILQKALGSPQGIDTSEHDMKEISHCYGSIFGEMQRSSLVSKNALDQVNFNIIKMGFSSALKKEDTLIPEEERKEMIVNFNNDLNKQASKDFIAKKTDEFPDAISDEGYVLVEHESSDGVVIDTTKEYKIKYTLTDLGGDTIISTVRDPESSEEFNSQTINTDEIVFPPVWSMAAKNMKVGGDYTIYSPYDLAYGEEGLSSPRSNGAYIIQPYAAIVIHTKVLRQDARNTAIKKRGQKVMEDAKAQPNTVVDASGYILTTLEEGTGKTVPAGSDVQAHYILTNSKGETVENSYQMAAQKNQPAPTFSLNSVVKGWSLAFTKMKKGGRYKLVLPPELGYGANGNQTILPYETLTFEIEVLDFGKEGSLVQQRPQQQGQQQQLSREQMEQLQKQMQQQQQQQGN